MKALSSILIFAIVSGAFAAEYHVAVTGNDANDGSASGPFKTISAAAQKAMPGDTITVHDGVYRERVNPPRGGESDSKRITYQAAPGEKVVLTGSEPVRGWEKVQGDTWKVTLANSYFGNFNPYCDRIRGDWFSPNGRVHHTGCVYLNGDWMIEARDLDEVMKPAGQTPLWFAQVDGDKGEHLVNLAWIKPGNGTKVPAGEPSWRYGGKPATCSEGGTCSGYILLGDQLRFDAVDFGNGTDTVEFRAAAPIGAGAMIELRLGSAQGELLGTCKIETTGDWQKWHSFTVKIKPTSGKQTVCLVFLNEAMVAGNTTIYTQFPGVNPNEAHVEINKRQTVFYPSQNFINYITVRGFTLENAATQWAPPSSEQTGLIGVNWSKGWIIENNTIRYSKCSGVALGKYGDGTDNTNDAGAADPYTACVRRALKNGWNKETVGSHTVRNNHIHHCEQTGIVGSLGCSFSTVTGNEIHDIHVRRLFGGAEMGGIKFHGGLDVRIAGNHIYRCGDISGIWLDWMAQNAHVTDNLMHDNIGGYGDIFFEMQHGPLLVANNLLLSQHKSFALNSQGIAFAHNLITGPIENCLADSRSTPYNAAHSTDIAGMHQNSRRDDSGDHRFYNNLLVATCNLSAIDNSSLPCFAADNVFTKGTQPSQFDTDALLKSDFDPGIKLEQKPDGWYLTITEDAAWRDEVKRKLVTTDLLGKAKIPNVFYENPDGTPFKIDIDYVGRKRDTGNPFPGPFEVAQSGTQTFKVWPKP